MAQGTVRWFSEEKGYGFIAPDDGGVDVFVHYTEIAGSGFRSLHEGERVTYELIQRMHDRPPGGQRLEGMSVHGDQWPGNDPRRP